MEKFQSTTRFLINKKKVLLLLVSIEITMILVICINIYNKKDNVLGTDVSINPIKRDDLMFLDDSNLRYYYEPKANNIINNKPVWLPNNYEYAMTINSDGLNERFNYSIEKQEGLFRIVTLGDSFTAGHYVDTKDNYPEKLEDLLNTLSCGSIRKFEVINLGVGGYDIEYSVRRFKNRGQKYSPDLIIWLVKADDFGQPIELLQPRFDFYKEKMERSGELENSRQKGNYYPFTQKAAQEFIEQEGEEKLLEFSSTKLATIDDYHKGSLLFIAFSSRMQKKYESIIESFLKVRQNTHYFNALPEYKSLGHNLPDGHPNSDGYTLIAKEVIKLLTEIDLIPCR